MRKSKRINRIQKRKNSKKIDIADALKDRQIIFNDLNPYFKGKSSISTLEKQKYSDIYLRRNDKIVKASINGRELSNKRNHALQEFQAVFCLAKKFYKDPYQVFE